MPAPANSKFLVCVFLFGANDHYNTVLATDTASWATYTAARGDAATGVALPPPGTAASASGTTNQKLGGALPITPNMAQAGRTFALHPVCTGIRDLFNAGKLAIVASVGNITGPTVKADYVNGAANIPKKLGSHNDQQSVWQAGGTEGTTRGWGGKMADILKAANSTPSVTAMSIRGNTPWTVGNSTRSFQMAPDGPITVGDASGQMYGSTGVTSAARALLQAATANRIIHRDLSAIGARSIATAGVLSAALPAAGAGAWSSPPAGELGPQLQAVARCIDASQALGMDRQIFFVGMGGWDHHTGIQDAHAAKLDELSKGLAWFQGVLDTMGVANQVTTFTMSDFGRAMLANATGTDHGWGTHTFVMGGAVKGKDIHGKFPDYGAITGGQFSSPDMVANGHTLPAQSIDQYAATLGAWFGATPAQLLTIFPNLSNWAAAKRNLGFMN